MTMNEFITTINRAAEIYNGEIISMRNDFEGNLHVLLTPTNFDALDMEVTAAYPCIHPACRGDWELEKQVGNIIFTVYHQGEYRQEEAS